MLRASMVAIVNQLRLLIGDPYTVTGGEVFSDDELQAFADAHSTDVLYQRLVPLPAVAPGGVTTQLQWAAERGWWETDAVVVDSGYNVLSPSAVDYARGRWTFGAHRDDVLVRGACYDLYAAGADAVEAWLARVKLEYDFSADGATYQRSQQMQGLRELLGRLRAQAGGGGGVTVGRMTRSDTQ